MVQTAQYRAKQTDKLLPRKAIQGRHSAAARALALLACAALFIVILFSVLFLVREAGHHCVGKGCLICACIHQGEQTLKRLGTGAAGVAKWIPAVGLLILTVFCALRAIPCETPVSQKVRVNN